MSDVVKFIFYYGPGTIQTTEMGADLSEFTHRGANERTTNMVCQSVERMDCGKFRARYCNVHSRYSYIVDTVVGEVLYRATRRTCESAYSRHVRC